MPFVASTPAVTAQPAKTIGRFFGDTFERRTGKRLRIVAGDQRLASLIALYARGRPELQRDGGIVVWPTTHTAGTPPPEIRARFPELVPEVPRAFDYPIQGRLPLLRIGWGMLRPQ